MRWFDEFRVWNSSFPFKCLPKVLFDKVSKNGAWIPDILITNGENVGEITRNEREQVLLRSDGFTSYTPMGIMKIDCSFDLTLFPFDTQSCIVVVESWRYDVSMLLLLSDDEGYRMLRVGQLKQWTVTQGSFKMSSLDYTDASTKAYSIAKYSVILKRKPGFYMMNTIVPSIFISLTELISYSIPIYCDGRLELSFTCVLAFGLFQGYIASELPRSADNPPLLSIYIIVMSAYIFMATCFHGVSRILYDYGNPKSDVPKWLKTKYFNPTSKQWKRYAKKWDKISMLIYLLSITLTPCIFFIGIPLLFR